MHFLAFLIAGFSVSIAALLSEKSDAADLPLLDSSFRGSLLSLNPTSGNEYPPLAGSSSLNPTTPGNKPSPFDFKPAQEPSASGAGESPIIKSINPSVTDTEAQMQTDYSNEICNPQTSTGRKRQESESCDVSGYLIRGPRVLLRGGPERTEEQKKNDELREQDLDWLKRILGLGWNDLSLLATRQRVYALNRSGKLECQGLVEQGGTYRPKALCCLGPEEEITLSNSGYRLVRRQLVQRNVFSCDMFMEGRPLCKPTKRYCCAETNYYDDDALTEWGYKGIDCVRMEWYPEIWPSEFIFP